MRRERASIEFDDFVDLRNEGLIAQDFGREPQMLAPWFELMIVKNALHRLR